MRLCRRWAAGRGVALVLVFDGNAPQVETDDRVRVVATHGESADDWLAREAAGFGAYWLVTSDRELRVRAGDGAERIVGGGSFARELHAYRDAGEDDAARTSQR